MDARKIRCLRRRLARYLGRFRDGLQGSSTWWHFSDLFWGQLSDSPRKSAQPLALAAGQTE